MSSRDDSPGSGEPVGDGGSVLMTSVFMDVIPLGSAWWCSQCQNRRWSTLQVLSGMWRTIRVAASRWTGIWAAPASQLVVMVAVTCTLEAVAVPGDSGGVTASALETSLWQWRG